MGQGSKQKMSDDRELDELEVTHCLLRMAQVRRERIDPVSLRSAVSSSQGKDPQVLLSHVRRQLMLPKYELSKRPDEGRCPLLFFGPDGWGVVLGRGTAKDWKVYRWSRETRAGFEASVQGFHKKDRFVRMRMQPAFSATRSTVLRIVLAETFEEKRALIEIFALTFTTGMLALAASLYSMQVYDRVIPTAASSTLLALTIGVLAAAAIETFGKLVRAGFLHDLGNRVDQRLARAIMARFMNVRLDQLPHSIGSTASRLRSYESVRNLVVAVSTFAAADVPIAVMLFLVLIAVGGYLAFVPAVFLFLGVVVGLQYKKKVEALAAAASPLHNRKTGILVESIEAAETIKSGNGGWKVMSQWLDITDDARQHDTEMKALTERSGFVIAFLQQFSYVMLIAVGATWASHGHISMGTLIACTILSGRVTQPIMTIPHLMVQWGQTKASVADLDQFWKLKQDHEEGTQPLRLQKMRGDYEISGLKMHYGVVQALKIDTLNIPSGSKVGIIGPIGSGKTTLLRALSGMYKPAEGRLRLDGVEVDMIERANLAQHIAYIPQDGRLFEGTVRENLVVGLDDPGDDRILEVCKFTGLQDLVLAPHPKGLDREITEGGLGLSGGQRQLVHLTRAFLKEPSVWLLDEPTASMDQRLENHVINCLQSSISASPKSTFIFITHKPAIVSICDRLIVIANGQVVLDGPRDAVLQKLDGNTQAA